jgi:hypothetical protein
MASGSLPSCKSSLHSAARERASAKLTMLNGPKTISRRRWFKSNLNIQERAEVPASTPRSSRAAEVAT